jgi:HD superfamily phosphodiesterase
MLAFFTAISKIMPKRRKSILLAMEVFAALLLVADRISYIYYGYPGEIGYLAVNLSNFSVFILTLAVLMTVNFYLDDVLKNEGGLESTPQALRLAMILGYIALFLVVVSEFTGLYYTVDEYNFYHRSPYYFISYIFPYLILVIQLGLMIIYGKRVRGKLALSLFLFVSVCTIASLVQYFFYGVSLLDMATVMMVVGLYVFALIDVNEKVERASRIEIDNLKGEHESMRKLFEQTATALATAIDAKDPYTQGHSVRVAEYAKEIAKLSGMDEKKCDEVYFAGLLHDVGKIGVPDSIIQKDMDLTDEEYDALRRHPAIGGQILSIIDEYPFLGIGAKYHHERYDGKGYPEGLSGEDIPELARIVAVADTYDSMTSKRSYRDIMPQSLVREEILKGIGTQFDPVYSRIMIEMIDKDTEYLMREKDNPQTTETLSAASGL